LRSPIKPEQHHWWPESLSALWAGQDGKVTRLAWDGSEVSSTPDNFGKIKNAHHIIFGKDNPWNASFERDFGKADTHFNQLCEWLCSLDSLPHNSGISLENRFLPHKPLRHQRQILAECLASLIVRSPNSRNRVRSEVKYFRDRFGFKEPPDKNLIAENMYNHQAHFRSTIDNGGKFSILFSDGPEFIFGDGFYHNFPTRTDHPSNLRCIVPILPTVSVLYTHPSVYRAYPEMTTLRLNHDEASFLNSVVQMYSCDYIFYQNQKPTINDSFQRHAHEQFKFHSHIWLDEMFEAVETFSKT
jgi:hypothetical protein